MEQINKYPNMNAMLTPTKSVDYYVKNNKLYRMYSERQIVTSNEELSEIIDELAIDCNYVVEKNQTNYMVLKQFGTEDKVEIITNKDENGNKYYTLYYYQPDLVDIV
jgi:hypothetical protein